MIRNCCQRAAGIFRRLCPKWCRLEMSSANLRFWWTLCLLLKSQQSSSIHVLCMVIKSPLWCSMKNSLHAGERSNELKVWETSPVCRVNKGDRSLSVLSRRWQKVPEEVSFFLSFFFLRLPKCKCPTMLSAVIYNRPPLAWVLKSRVVNSWQFSGCAAKCHFPPEMLHEGRSSMRLSR